jgi:CubicO group peptidase (beta-lactamase class C family)
LAGSVERQGFSAAAASISSGDEAPVEAFVGHATVGEGHDAPEPLGPAHRFDWASLTKVATTACVLTLVESGRLRLDDPARRWVPCPDAAVTVRDLLTHRAGLWEWQPLHLVAHGREQVLRAVEGLGQRYPRGAGWHYSDLSMVLLGALVEEVVGLELRSAVGALVTGPLGMTHTAYGPVPAATAVATALGDAIDVGMVSTGDPFPVVVEATREVCWRRHRLRGEVHDANAHHALDGVSGHAGLFGTLADLRRLGHAFLDDSLAGAQVRAEFLQPLPEGQALGLRWSMEPTGPAYWHGGFTGTRLQVEPTTGRVTALLTNRLSADRASRSHPDITPLWRRVLAPE